MRRLCIIFAAIGLLGGVPAFAGPSKPEALVLTLNGNETPEQLQQLYGKTLAELAAAIGNDAKDKEKLQAVNTLEALVHQAARPGAEPQRIACCKAMAAALEGDAAVDAKLWMLKFLTYAGKEEVISVVAKLLDDKEPLLRETARCALQQNPAPEAAKALFAALGKASDPAWQTALALALGARKDSAGDPAVVRLLAAAERQRPARLAALQEKIRAAGDTAGTIVAEFLSGDDADARAIAAGSIPDLSSGAAKQLTAGIARLPAASQRLVVEGLASRGEKAALPAAMEFAKGVDEDSRLVGLRALGRLGDASNVPLLAEVLPIAGPAGSEARDALVSLSGAGVTEAIVAVMQQQSDIVRRLPLVEVLEARSDPAAVPALLQEAVGSDPKTCRTAIRALGKLALPKDVRALIPALLKTSPGGDRDDAEKTIMLACTRTADPQAQADPVLEIYGEASAENKRILLSVLGRIGGAKALAVIKTAMASSDPDVSAAGLRGLCNWPDPSVAGDLLQLAKSADDGNRRIAALRALVRVAVLPDGLPNEQKLSMLQKAMDLAERDAERNLVLSRAAAVYQVEALRFVLPYLDKPELSKQACATICDLAHRRELRGKGKAEFEAALQRVLAVSKDRNVLESAKRSLRGE
jgi:HEAT repeat protein